MSTGLISGGSVDEGSGRRLSGAEVVVTNPATGEVAGRVPDLTPDEVHEMAERLRAAQPAWEALGPEGRAQSLLAWLDWIVDNQDHVLGLVHREAGKSWGDASIELMVCVEVINYYAKNGAKFLAEEKRRIHGPASFNKRLRILRRPYPLVGVITPWNYPLAMAMMDVPGALMAGAAVLTKPSEVTPLAWAEVVRAWNEEIDAPPVLGCATGTGGTGSAVVEAVDMIQFTGSTKTGRAIGVRAAERLIPSSLELGGKDAMIVLSDADLDRAVKGAVWGGLFNAGQSCIAVERLYVEAPVYDEFVGRLVDAVGNLRQGHDRPGEFAADYGAMATQAQLEIVERHVADAVHKGAKVLTGGRRADHGLFYPATVLVDVDHTMTCMRDETFGPLLPVMKVESEDEAIRLANDSPYGLGGSVWTGDPDRGRRVGTRVETGGMNVNNAMTNVFQFPLPMGGWKQSGLGHRFGGPNGVRKYTRQQAFVTEKVPLKNELHWYPYSPLKGAVVGHALRLTGMHDWRRRLGLAAASKPTKHSPKNSPNPRNIMTETTAAPMTDAKPLDAATIPEAFQRVVARYGDQPALRTIDESVNLSWAELDSRVRATAAGLAGLGLGRGDTVALLLPNTIECHLLDYAAYHIGAVPFAVFNSSPAEQIRHQMKNADASVVITQQAFLPKVQEAVAALGDQVRHLVVVDADVDGTLTLADLEAAADPAFDVDAAWQAVTADDLSTLIYTSGTTGTPKGAQWSHRTVMAQQRALDAALPLPTIGIISFLPMAHAGGRITSQYMALAYGAAITVCPDMTQVPMALGRHRPDAFFSVPRLWEKLQVGIEAMVAGTPDEDQRVALERAIETGRAAVAAAEAGSGASDETTARLAAEHSTAKEVLQPLLERLGLDRIKAAFVGGAPSAPELSSFFRAVGVPMLEAYGLTEGSLNVFNRIDDFKAGTAGKPLPGVELRLDEDGELLVRADLNFVGYRKQPEATAAALDADGWLHTGDIATIDDDGFVTIVDRKKEIIINSSGKNMSPATIESAIKGESSLIGLWGGVGSPRRYVTALITLDPEALTVLAKRLGLQDTSLPVLADHPEVHAEVKAAVDRGNQRLNSNEQVKKFTILPGSWMPDSDELTPTAKLKRRVIHRKYAEQIDALYEA